MEMEDINLIIVVLLIWDVSVTTKITLFFWYIYKFCKIFKTQRNSNLWFLWRRKNKTYTWTSFLLWESSDCLALLSFWLTESRLSHCITIVRAGQSKVMLSCDICPTVKHFSPREQYFFQNDNKNPWLLKKKMVVWGG